MKWRSQLRLITRIFVVLSLIATSPSVSAEEEKDLEPVVLQLKWSHQFQFAGYYMAKELGYYEDEGLDVEIRAGSSTLNVTEEVLSGRADFGVGTSSLLLDYAAGKPVVVLGVIYQHSPLVLLMPTEESFNTIERIAEGPVMMESHSGDLLAMLRRAGLDIAQLNIVDYPEDAMSLLASREEVFSISAYQTDEPYTLRQQDISFHIFSPQTYGIDFYGDNFFTTKQMIAQKGSLAQGFRRATMLGWEEVLRDPEKAITLILKDYPAEVDREKLRYEARVTRDLMTNLVKPGHMNQERWQHISETFQEVGMLTKSPDLEGFVFMEKKRGLPKWFWPALLCASVLVLFLALLSAYLRGLNVRLQREVQLRVEAEKDLKTTNRELTIAKKISEEANLKKTWFITNVSHDLRAPVSSMISLTQIFNHHGEKLELPEKFKRFLSQMNSGGEFLMLMLDNILDHSAFEINAVSVNPEKVDLVKCCEGLVGLSQPLADEKEVSIQVQWQGEDTNFAVDRIRLSQIFLNLLHNAIKFSPRGGVISLDLTVENAHLKAKIEDQGPGIPPERRADLFKMFGKSDKSASRHSSTGLGLSIVKRNIELLNGTIHVEEGEPRGAVFQIVIPVVQEPLSRN